MRRLIVFPHRQRIYHSGYDLQSVLAATCMGFRLRLFSHFGDRNATDHLHSDLNGQPLYTPTPPSPQTPSLTLFPPHPHRHPYPHPIATSPFSPPPPPPALSSPQLTPPSSSPTQTPPATPSSPPPQQRQPQPQLHPPPPPCYPHPRPDPPLKQTARTRKRVVETVRPQVAWTCLVGMRRMISTRTKVRVIDGGVCW